MTGVDVMSQCPLDYAAPEHLTQLLGVADPDLVSRLMSVAPLRPLMSARLDEVLGDPEDLPVSDLVFMMRIVNAELDALLQAARIISVLVHAPSLATTADGAVLRLAIAHTGTRTIARHMRDANGPTFDRLPHTAALTQEVLDLYAREALRYLVGLIPERLLQRVILRFPVGVLPAPARLSDAPASLANFRRLVEIALDCMDEAKAKGGGASSDDAAADETDNAKD